MEKDLSLHAFMQKLAEELQDIAKQEGLDLAKAENSGYAFALWIADVLMRRDVGLEEDLDDVVLRGGSDLGVDIVLRDDANRTLVLVQAKNRGTSRKAKPIDSDALDAFLHRHSDLLDPQHIERGNERTRELLTSYKERMDAGWKARFYYITSAGVSDTHDAKVERHNRSLDETRYDIEYALYDRGRLRDLYMELQSLTASIPEEVTIDLPQGTFFEKCSPHPCLIAILKGNSLRNEYNKKGRKESLFAWNIRNYLGDRGINKGIRATAEECPGDFFYFNNGITAVCKDFVVDGNKLQIKKFQVINGAQTLASIARAQPNVDVEVLFKLIKTGKVETDAGINREIIRANNTQNAIKLSDFRANDPIQRWLESSFKSMRAHETTGKLTYQPKRSGRRGAGRTIKLEELAKIRYAYLYDPLLVHAAPVELWTEGGAYEKAFGINGERCSAWSRDMLNEAVLAVAFHDAARAAAKEARKADATSRFFHRLRFHAVALAGVYMRGSKNVASDRSLLGSRSKFDALWEQIWDEARKLLNMTHLHYIRNADPPMTMFAFVRSERIWDGICENFHFNLQLQSIRTPVEKPRKAAA